MLDAYFLIIEKNLQLLTIQVNNVLLEGRNLPVMHFQA